MFQSDDFHNLFPKFGEKALTLCIFLILRLTDVTRCESGYMSVYVEKDTVHYFQK